MASDECAIDAWRQNAFGTTNNSGIAADSADPDGDGNANLVEFVLGRPPKVADAGRCVVTGRVAVSGQDYLTLTFARKLSASGITLQVEAADGPAGPWTQIDPLDVANQVSVQSSVPAVGWETLTVKDVVTTAGRAMRCLRLRVTRP